MSSWNRTVPVTIAGRHAPAWVVMAGLGALLTGSWALVFLAGGSHTALPHVFYVPIVVAAVSFATRGGVTVGVAATVLSGPLMPLDVAAGTSQALTNWLTRGVFFVAIGVLTGAATLALRHSFEQHLTSRFSHELDAAAARRDPTDEITVNRIRHALEHRTFHPVFQPIYTLDDGRLLAVEALTRFDTTPSRPPDVWFHQAARAGLGIELELATIDAALDEAQRLPADVAVSVNTSPDTLIDPRLPALLDRHTRPVIVEITEHAIIDDYPRLEAALRQLRRRGIQVAVDDAGAGFASLRHIVRLTPDFIKLDISLTQGLRDDPVRRALATALVQFAHTTGAQLIAEGIEHADDLETWTALGAHAAQGYLLAAPGPLTAIPQQTPPRLNIALSTAVG